MDGREPVVVEARRTSLVDVQATYVRVESLRTAGAPPPTDELVRLRALEAEHARMVATVERLAATLQADHQQLSQACLERASNCRPAS